jgi:hypothetical protein
MSVYLMSMYLMGVHLTGLVPHGRVSHERGMGNSAVHAQQALLNRSRFLAVELFAL